MHPRRVRIVYHSPLVVLVASRVPCSVPTGPQGCFGPGGENVRNNINSKYLARVGCSFNSADNGYASNVCRDRVVYLRSDEM